MGLQGTGVICPPDVFAPESLPELLESVLGELLCAQEVDLCLSLIKGGS